jgi:hypothetical protein
MSLHDDRHFVATERTATLTAKPTATPTTTPTAAVVTMVDPNTRNESENPLYEERSNCLRYSDDVQQRAKNGSVG